MKRANNQQSDLTKPLKGHESFETLFTPPRPVALTQYLRPADERNVIIGKPNQGFISNHISTTKYTLVTFLPKNLFEQFMRVANFYFLIMAVLECIPAISPYAPWTSVTPLVFVLAVTAIKEAYEDWRRWVQDRESNDHPVEVVRGNHEQREWTRCKWSEVKVGELVRVTCDEPIPCDMVILSSSEEMGVCYIESANLDGETNLKVYQAHPKLVERYSTQTLSIDGTITCEPPNNRIYKFFGRVTCGTASQSTPLDYRQLLLRGHTLRNTEYVIGVAVYTGNETKLMKNSNKTYLKQSRLEGKANRNIMFMMMVQVSLSLVAAIFYSIFVDNNPGFWYLDLKADGSPAEAGALNFFTWLILVNTLIPISLYVSIELVKVGQAIFLGWDKNMYSEEYKVNAQARTSNLNEELGQVQYIFSDKTGTLTRNQMDFIQCSIGGQKYGQMPTETTRVHASSSVSLPPASADVSEQNSKNADDLKELNSCSRFRDELFDEHLASEGEQCDRVRHFLLTCAICHTVVKSRDSTDEKPHYQGASPDEIALVRFAAAKGYKFVDRDPASVVVEIAIPNQKPRRVRYEILHIIEFDSTRKRMSVIVRDPETNEPVLYCKGADSAILEKLSESDQTKTTTSEHLSSFAKDGLRTLCLAYSPLSAERYNSWKGIWVAAEVALVGRDEKIAAAAEIMETDLRLVGVSAIEDKLQLGVPETISTLLRANINIWMLTGDKEETAINIGLSCRLIDSHDLVYLTSSKISSAQEAGSVLESVIARNKGSTTPVEQVIIDGKTLEWCLTQHADLLLSIAPISRAVIVCRATPLQKAEIVTLVKLGMNKITLAIGDGANDVPMIQAAHIGIGIEGEEGCQAVRSSDYSIGQFRFLQWLLLVQGRWFYERIAILFLYSFYKNCAFTLCHVWLGLRSSFSGQSFYNDMTISVFNMFYTSLPILLIGVFDRDLKPSTILENPELYLSSQQNQNFKLRRFWTWIVWGCLQSILIFVIPIVVFHASSLSTGERVGLWGSSATSTFIVVLIANIKILIAGNLFNWLHGVALFLGVLMFFVVSYGYELYLSLTAPSDPLVGVTSKLCSEPLFWAIVLFVTVVVSLPDILASAIGQLFYPTSADKLKQMERRGQIKASRVAATETTL